MTILSVIGARPQFVKAAVVSRALREQGATEILIHTGQHYDPAMSRVFFDELDIPAPDLNLAVGSSSHAEQTGAMMVGLEKAVHDAKHIDWMLVYGDTNSTLAASLVAAKMHVPLAHVEAGLRSFNRRMPEEINRIVTDRLSTVLFCPTTTAVRHLADEGIRDGVLYSGDVMLDATRFYARRAAERAPLESLGDLAPGSYHLATVHRAENTDDPGRLGAIFDGLARLDRPVLLPLHPRTRTRLSSIEIGPNIRIMEPAGYLAMLTLVRNARRVFTDSGGLQKEAVWLGTPCVTLRDETEWVETTEGGWNRVVGAEADRIVEAAALDPTGPAPVCGAVDGKDASSLIASSLIAR